MLRVFVVDDHPVMRQGIGLLLAQAGMEVAGTAATVDEALTSIPGAGADVALVDLGLAEGSGLSLLDALARRPDAPRRLVYSMNEDAASVERSLGSGADGYVTKGEVWETLIHALRAVAAGERYLSPRARRALDGVTTPAEIGEVEFSKREGEVFHLLGEGFSNAEIATRLGLSPRTVESYCARLLEKLRLGGMRELRRKAIAARRE